MYATGMAPPKPADKAAVKDNHQATTPTPTPTPNPPGKTSPKPNPNPTQKRSPRESDSSGEASTLTEGRTTRSRSESGGRAQLRCKVCPVTFHNYQDFTQHRCTGHERADAADTDDAAQLHEGPVRTRFSTRLKRAASSEAEGRRPSKKIAALLPGARKGQAGSRAESRSRRQSGSGGGGTPSNAAPKEGHGLKIKLYLPPGGFPKKVAVSKASDEDGADTAEPEGAAQVSAQSPQEARKLEPESPEQENPSREEDPKQENREQDSSSQEKPQQEIPAQEKREQENPTQEIPEQENSTQEEKPEQENSTQEENPKQENPTQEENLKQENPTQENPTQEGNPEQEKNPTTPDNPERDSPKRESAQQTEASDPGSGPCLDDGDDDDVVMISTNGPQGLAAHNDLSVSGTSEDEDMGEDGGRLVIDDSVTPGGSSSSGGSGSSSNGGVGAVPTRCGNIQNRTYMCSDCPFTTTSAKQNLEHRKNVHKHDFTIYSCNLCEYATKYKQKLPRHYKLHFPGANDLPVEGQIPENMLSALDSPLRTPTLTSTLTLTPTLTLGGSNNSAGALSPTSLPVHPPSHAATPTSSPAQGFKRSSMEAGLISATPSVLPAEVILEEGEEEEEDEIVESDTTTPPPEDPDGEGEGEGLVSSAAAALEPPAKKKRKDVSPDKYFEVAEEVAYTKYGCAKCGNVYKWKKSLNKHWKEKHGNDPGDSQYTPPGMLILLQQNNHVQTEHRRCCHKTFLEQITVKRHDASGGASRAHSPQNFLNGHYNGQLSGQEDDVDGEEPASYAGPSIPAGPFVLGTTSQPVFPTLGQRQSLINNLHAPIPSSAAASSVLDLTTHNTPLDETDSSVDEAASVRPLDFSVSKCKTPPPRRSLTPRPPASSSSMVPPRLASSVEEEDQEVSALNELQASSSCSRDSPGKGCVLKCPKCGEVLKTQTAYSNHLAMHLQSANKKVAKCGVCQLHYLNNEALNKHFMDTHMDLITSHKEAIQKIPHGLQQTYHLLKMPLHTISKLSTSETDDPLKCNMCEFTAKWPAELQKHAVSHSDERPFVCMVCGSTYKWKWDLVKHFEKAHSNLPNPYKRREAGASSTAPSGVLDAQGGLGMSGGPEYDLEEGEISLLKIKEQASSRGVDSPGSFLFEQSPAQDDSSVENLLRTSHQASLMMSRQPNFLDSPENTQASASASASPSQDNNGGERIAGFDMSAMHGMNLPSTSTGLPFNSDNMAALSEDGQEHRHSKHGPIRSGRVHVRDADQPFPSRSARPKSGSKGKGPYTGYRTVVGSESSDLKYQCLQCDYKARWPSEIMQHMKNHSTEKPYGCPYCTYRSKWKWDVVKHLKRCGKGGTIKDVIDYNQRNVQRDAPPNVMVTPEGSVVQSQQAASPVQGTSASEGPASVGHSMASEAQVPVLASSSSSSSSFLQSLVPSTSTAPTVPIAMTPQDYVNLIYQQHSKAVSEALSSAVNGSPAPSTAESSPAEAQGSQQPVTYNSIINQGQHHCLHCTHVASSVAELRRHQVTHSEEKPFTCDECSYSTKWKCDMKKHKEKYKHHGPIRVLRPGSDGKDEDKQGGHKCPHCPFETYSAEVLQTHLKTGHPPTKKSPPELSKFRCKKCPFTTNELGDWINHRRQHQKDQEDSRQSPSVNGCKELDEARLKHPRKAIKKHHCSKCSFVCLKSRELVEHQQQVHAAHNCPFCAQRFDTKDSFLDHLVTHPEEFNHKEWEYFFSEFNDNEDVNNNTDTPPPAAVEAGRKAKVKVVDTGSSANTIDLTSTTPSTTTLLPAQVLMAANASQSSAVSSSLPCQWCDARFPNVVRLYNHVSDVHPNQKRQQEIAEGLKTSPPPGLFQPLAPAKSGKQVTPTLAMSKAEIKSLVQQAGKASLTPAKLNGRLSGLNPSLPANMTFSLLQTPAIMAQLGHPSSSGMSSTSTTSTSSSSSSLNAGALSLPQALAASKADIGLNLSTKRPEEKQPRVFQCIKCPYKNTALEEYMQHLLTHDSLPHLRGMVPAVAASKPHEPRDDELRCLYCQEAPRSFMELCQHLQTQHPLEIATRPDKYLEFLQKIFLQASKRPEMSRGGEPSPALTSAAALVASAGGAAGQDPTGTSAALPSFLHKKKMLTYNGYPLQVLRLPNSGEVWYKCAVCNFMDRLPENISKHTRQVPHSIPKKFQCAICGYSDNAVKTVMRHHEGMHPNQPASIAVIELEEIAAPSRQPLRENSTGFSPSSAASPLAMTSAPVGGLGQVVGSSIPALQTPLIKRERPSLSPPQAASTPVDPALDCAPLDLSTESAEDRAQNLQPVTRRAGSSEGHPAPPLPPPPPPAAENADQRKLVDAGSGEALEAEVQEIMEAEAATSHPGKVCGTSEDEEESDLPQFKCKHCPFACRSSYEFRTHCSYHGLKSRYLCDYCTFSHNQVGVVAQHRTVHSAQRGFNPIYTPKLNEAASERAGIVSPAPAAAVPDTLRCSGCPYKTTDRNAFTVHSRMHGRMSQYICDFCDWSSDRLTILVQHRAVHSSEPDFDPSPEDRAFANPEYVKVVSGEFEAKLLESRSPAEEQARSSSPSSRQTPQYKLAITKRTVTCADCPYTTKSKQAFAFHVSQHDGPGCYPCAQCSYRTSRWGLLCQHNRLHDGHPQREADKPDQAATPAATTSSARQEEGVSAPSALGDGAAPAAAAAPAGGGEVQSGEEEEQELQHHGDTKGADTEDLQSAELPEQTAGSVDGSPGSGNASPSTTEGGNQASAEEGEDLRCERCPFCTTSRLLLSQHSKHHSGNGQVLCPCCDYTCPSKEVLLTHIQLHFPSMPVDLPALEHMLDKQQQSQASQAEPKTAAKDAGGCSLTSSDKADSESVSGAEDGEDRSAGAQQLSGPQPAPTPAPTKVYACRYCDLEFEDKERMIQHERQHQA